MRRTMRRRVAALAAVALVPLTALAVNTTGADAITGDPGNPQTLPASDTPMWQTNNAVWATVVNNGVLYVAGQFDKIRPPNTATGAAGETTMSRLAAFNAIGPNIGQPCVAATPCPGIGVWTNPQITGGIAYSLAVTPDGNTLYVGGDFTSAKGQARGKAAAFDISSTSNPSNRLVNWNPTINGSVRAIAATDTTAYFGGAFTTAAGQTRQSAAAYDRTTHALTAWSPTFNAWQTSSPKRLSALMVAPNNTGQIVLGGAFSQVNGAAHLDIAQVDATTGKVNGPMSNSVIPVGNGYSEVKALTTDGTNIYAGSEGTGPSVFDGTVSVNPTTGALVWRTDCHGATQAIAVLNGALYVGSHAHDCTSPPIQGGGFGQAPFLSGADSWNHLMAERANDGGTSAPGGALLNWWPKANPGPTNGTAANELGPRAMALSGSTLFVGGQSTTMNGRPQQGIAMFQPGADTTAPTKPSVDVSVVNGVATVRWIGSTDPDDKNLTYTVNRDGTDVYTTTGSFAWWNSPSFIYKDATAGTSYTVTATDADGVSSSSTVTATPGGYAPTVLADNPLLYWRLNQTAGPTALDSSGHAKTGTFRGNYSYKKAGAVTTDTAVTEGNTTATSIAANGATAAAPANFSMELWFRSTATNGGRLIGYATSATGTTASPNRVLYMATSGQLIYAVRNNDGSTCNSTNVKYSVAGWCYAWARQSYNDGTWHHAVVTQAGTALTLYVDGAKVANNNATVVPKPMTGVWKVGADGLNGVPRKPGGSALPGDIDEVAIYPTALSAAQVAAHYNSAE